jgi:tRNA synthetases class II (D, K and N)
VKASLDEVDVGAIRPVCVHHRQLFGTESERGCAASVRSVSCGKRSALCLIKLRRYTTRLWFAGCYLRWAAATAPHLSYVDAFSYSIPPHGGFAIGPERFVARLPGLGNVREATAFPRDRIS